MTYMSRDGIDYYTLATTGGHLAKDSPSEGFLDHVNLVTVRPDKVVVATLPVGGVLDPRELAPVMKTWSQTLVARRDFVIQSEKDRVLEFPLRAPTPPEGRPVIHIGIGHGVDDTGDKGLWYRLVDDNGAVFSSRFIRSKGVYWVSRAVPPGSHWTLLIEDLDTSFGGPNPGNVGTIEVHVE
jgi:hypothetical protein